MQKLKLLKIDQYPPSEEDNPLPLYYWPLIGRFYRERVELCLNALQPGERVLEVGFGSGISIPNLSELYSEVFGIDLNADVEKARESFTRLGFKTDLRHGNLLDLPYSDGTFDSVLCISILEHLKPQELPHAFREIVRVLKKGGRFVYGIPVERRLMVLGFRLLGYDIRKHHFSTEIDVARAAELELKPLAMKSYKPLGGILGPLYQMGVYAKV